MSSKSIDLCPLFGQLQETTIEKFEKTVKDDNIPIVISISDDSPLQLDQYVELGGFGCGIQASCPCFEERMHSPRPNHSRIKSIVTLP
jgi:hypothetical protein